MIREDLKSGVGDLGDRDLLVVGLLRRVDGRVRGEHEVDARGTSWSGTR